MSNTAEQRSFGVDLITFFHPEFWGLDSREAFSSAMAAEPKLFWNTIFDALDAGKVSQLEMTFPPADRLSALAAFGSVDGFREALHEHGISVVSSYFGAIEHAENLDDPATRETILREAETEAEFLSAIGARYLVVGLPMRKNREDGLGLQPVDLRVAEPIAELLNELGAITARHGVKVALHTESHSVFWTSRDVDLFMLLTDPMLVSFCPDTGHIVLGGGDPVEIASRHRDRIVLAHWKDAIGAFDGQTQVDGDIFQKHQEYFRPAGLGKVDWFAWARLLRSISYRGDILLELDASPRPVEQLTQARMFLETVVKDIL